MNVLVSAMTSRYSDELDCRWLLWPSTVRERVKFIGAVLTSRVVIRVGMPFEFRSETNRLWLMLLKVAPRLVGVNYWIGSDVLNYRERLSGGEIGESELRAVRAMHHFAGSDSLCEELGEAGVCARTVILLSPEREVPESAPSFPDVFRVLAYIPDSRFEFYGGHALFAAARAMPDTEFDIVGGLGDGVADIPLNVRYYGRVEDIETRIENSVVLVRLVRHDAVASSIIEEAMVFGRHVIYSFHWPHTTFVEFGDESKLIAALKDLRHRFLSGALGLNVEGRDFTIHDWDPDIRSEDIRKALLEVAHRSARRK